MFSLRQFFSTKKNADYPNIDMADEELSQLRAPGTKILYDPNLIDKLVKDHSQLVSVYTDLNKAIEKELYGKMQGLLTIFLALFNEHALAEYTKLYVFLDYSLRPYPSEHKQVMSFRKEMQEIGKVVRLFVHNWKNTGVDASNISMFSDQLQEIGKVLSKRISVEEKQLYQIYADAPKLLNKESRLTH